MILFLLLFILAYQSCAKTTNDQDTKIRFYTLRTSGLYPKIFSCIGKKEALCIYFTAEDGTIRFTPLERIELEEAPPAFVPDKGLAIPLMFSEKITAVIQISQDHMALGYRLISGGTINLSEFVSFASAKNDVLLFGDNTYIKIASENTQMQIPNDKNNIITDNQEQKTIEITGNWMPCSDIVITKKGIEGIVFSNTFSGIRYFLVQSNSSSTEFVGWRTFQEDATYTESKIPYVFLITLSEEAYPSVDSTDINPLFPFGFIDTKNVWFSIQRYDILPPRIKIRYVGTSRKFEPICSISSDGSKTFVFAEDKTGLYIFQRKSRWEWVEEKITDNSYGYLNSFIFNGTPCAIFTGKDNTLKVTCKISGAWKIKTIDPDEFSGINLYTFQENSRLHIVYNLIRSKPLIRYAQIYIDSLFSE